VPADSLAHDAFKAYLSQCSYWIAPLSQCRLPLRSQPWWRVTNRPTTQQQSWVQGHRDRRRRNYLRADWEPQCPRAGILCCLTSNWVLAPWGVFPNRHIRRKTLAQIGIFPHRRQPQHPLASRPGHSSSPRMRWPPGESVVPPPPVGCPLSPLLSRSHTGLTEQWQGIGSWVGFSIESALGMGLMRSHSLPSTWASPSPFEDAPNLGVAALRHQISFVSWISSKIATSQPYPCHAGCGCFCVTASAVPRPLGGRSVPVRYTHRCAGTDPLLVLALSGVGFDLLPGDLI